MEAALAASHGLRRQARPRRRWPTFADLEAHYRQDWMPTLRSQEFQEGVLRIVRKEFGELPLVMLTPERVTDWKKRLERKSLSPTTIRKYLLFLRGMWRRSAETPEGLAMLRTADGHVLANPVDYVRMPMPRKALKKYLELAQARQWLAANREGDPVMWRWSLVLLETGIRVQEAMRMAWTDVNLDAGQAAVRVTKDDRPRWIALDCLAQDGSREKGELVTEMDTWHQEGAVIGQEFAAFDLTKKRWKETFERAGIPYGGGERGFTARNLRTTFIKLAFDNGAKPEDLVHQTGHTLDTLTRHYLGFSPSRRRRARAALPKLLSA